MASASMRRGVGALASAAGIAAAAMMLAGPAHAAPTFPPSTSPAPVWYRAGSDTHDTYGNAANLAVNGGVSYVPGQYGDTDAFSFDGTSGLAGTATLGNVRADAFYLSLDMKTTQGGSKPTQLVDKGTACGVAAYLDVSMLPNGAVHVEYRGQAAYASKTGTFGKTITSTTKVNDGTWHSVVVAQYGSTLRLYVDWTHQVRATIAQVPDINNTAPFRVANGDACVTNGSRQPYVGVIDNVYLQNVTDNGDLPANLSTSQENVPTVPAGKSGSMTVDLANLSSTTDAHGTYNFAGNANMTITGISGVPGCTYTIDAVTCSEVPLAADQTAKLTIEFTVDSDAPPGSTLTILQGLFNEDAPDRNHHDDTFPMTVKVAPVAGTPMAAWQIALPVLAGLGLLGGGFVWFRRRRTSAVPA